MASAAAGIITITACCGTSPPRFPLEFGRPRLRELFAYADSIHNNFYEHRFDREEVQFYLER